MESFGGKKPYLSDFEIADDLTPDPYSEEPVKTLLHTGRESLRAEHLKKRKRASGRVRSRTEAEHDPQED